MQLRKGNAVFNANAVGFTQSYTPIEDAAGRVYAYLHTFSAEGYLDGTSQGQIATLSAQLELALAIPNEDIVFHADDGSIAAGLFASTALGGVQVRAFGYPVSGKGSGYEFVSGRSFAFVATGEYASPLFGSMLFTEFNEAVTITGGGPRRGILQPVNGPPIEQLIYVATPYRATQQGTAVGLHAYPDPMPALWPDKLVEAGAITRQSAQRAGVVPHYRGFRTNWAYEFVSATPLFGGSPNQWLN
jgi:hypothetical protein